MKMLHTVLCMTRFVRRMRPAGLARDRFLNMPSKGAGAALSMHGIF